MEYCIDAVGLYEQCLIFDVVFQQLGDSGDSPEWTGDTEAMRAKRGHVLRELLDTERVYVSELCSILKVGVLYSPFFYSNTFLSPKTFYGFCLDKAYRYVPIGR